MGIIILECISNGVYHTLRILLKMYLLNKIAKDKLGMLTVPSSPSVSKLVAFCFTKNISPRSQSYNCHIVNTISLYHTFITLSNSPRQEGDIPKKGLMTGAFLATTVHCGRLT